MKITLDVHKTLEENAAVYYEKGKKAKGKIAKIQEVVQQTQKKLNNLMKERDKLLAQLSQAEDKRAEKKSIKKEWYEKFRWFFTSSGLLAVGGRDATSNEIVIKKHAETGDVVFHTDIAGSPFFVLKVGDGEIDEDSKKEVAQATGAYSRAWEAGYPSIEVFSGSPDQFSKTPESGEYLSKGAFVVRGKVERYKPELMLAIGMSESGRIMGGPVSAVAEHCEKHVVIKQGRDQKSDIAKKILKHIGGDLDSIIQVLPNGGSALVQM